MDHTHPTPFHVSPVWRSLKDGQQVVVCRALAPVSLADRGAEEPCEKHTPSSKGSPCGYSGHPNPTGGNKNLYAGGASEMSISGGHRGF